MTRLPFKLVHAALFLLFPLSAVARPQYHETPEQFADDEKKALADAKAAWDRHCRAAFEGAHPGSGLHLLTGPETGYYNKVGKAITAVLAEKTGHDDGAPLEIEPIASKETTCNLLGLEAKKIEFALVQSDIAHDAWFGHPPVRAVPAQDLTLIAPLFVEAVHIVIRPHLNLARLSDLRGRRVWLGTENSLTVLTAQRILEAAGLTSRDIGALDDAPVKKSSPDQIIRQMSSTEALEALRRLDLDAMFQVGAFPFDSIHDAIVPTDTDGWLLDAERNKKSPCDAVRKARTKDPTLLDSELHLFNLDVDLVERLVADGSYIEQLIPPDAYCQQKATLTVGVRALLLTNRPNSDPVAKRLASALNIYQRDMETVLRQQIEVLQKLHGDPITGIPSRLSLLRIPTPPPLAVRYHPMITMDKIYFDPSKEILRSLAISAAVLAFGFLVAYRFRRIVGPWLARHDGWVVGAMAPILLWVATSFALKYYEGSVNEDFNTSLASLRSTFQYLVIYRVTGAFGTFGNTPITQNGQAALTWSGRIFASAAGLLLVPTILSWCPKLWAKANAWLQSLGDTPPSIASAPATGAGPTTEAPGAPDHTVPPHPAPSH